MGKGRRKYATLFAAILIVVFLRIIASADPVRQLGSYVFKPVKALISDISFNPDSEQQVQVDVDSQLQSRMDALEAENEELRNQLNFVEEAQFSLVSADIIGHSVQTYRKTVTINAGSNSGIQRDMPVMYNGQLVGMVQSAQENTAVIILLGDQDFRAAAKVEGANAIGIVSTKAGAAILDQVSVFGEELGGKRVLTSGLGGLFPPNIPIGTVGESLSKESDIFKEFALNTGIRVDQLNQVMVVVGYVSSP